MIFHIINILTDPSSFCNPRFGMFRRQFKQIEAGAALKMSVFKGIIKNFNFRRKK